jgi:hypothetical protein
MFRFGGLTVTAEDLTVWKQYPSADFVRLADRRGLCQRVLKDSFPLRMEHWQPYRAHNIAKSDGSSRTGSGVQTATANLKDI